MLIQQNNINFTSKVLPSKPLQSTFWDFMTNENILYRRRFLNALDAILNDGKSDIIEIKRTSLSDDNRFIQGYVNNKPAVPGYSYDIKKNNAFAYHSTEAVCTVIERLQKLQTTKNAKMKKFGLRKMKELYNKIFDS